MAGKFIYFNDELTEKLKGIDNVSKLISNLLSDYFNSNLSPEDQLKEINSQIRKLEIDRNRILDNIYKLELKRIESLKEYEEEKQKKHFVDWDKIRITQRAMFNNYLIPKEDIENLFEEYFNLLKEDRIKNIIEFMNNKGIIRKTKKIENELQT